MMLDNEFLMPWYRFLYCLHSNKMCVSMSSPQGHAVDSWGKTHLLKNVIDKMI